MLRSLEDLGRYTISALDGDIGTGHDFYFDDESWNIRYLVVDTGLWLPGRKVLIDPTAFGQPDWESEKFPVMLTQEQVENSPEIDTDKPISRQQEAELRTHYGWPDYWTRGIHFLNQEGIELLQDTLEETLEAKEPEAEKAAEEKDVTEEEQHDVHLRSIREVIGYHIEASDGEIGHVEDFIVNDESWALEAMVADIPNWFTAKKVLVSSQHVESINWVEGRVYVNLLRETIRSNPEYDPLAPVNREYEVRFYDYLGRPRE